MDWLLRGWKTEEDCQGRRGSGYALRCSRRQWGKLGSGRHDCVCRFPIRILTAISSEFCGRKRGTAYSTGQPSRRIDASLAPGPARRQGSVVYLASNVYGLRERRLDRVLSNVRTAESHSSPRVLRPLC